MKFWWNWHQDGIIEEIDEDGSGTVDFDGNISITAVVLVLFLFFLVFVVVGINGYGVVDDFSPNSFCAQMLLLVVEV